MIESINIKNNLFSKNSKYSICSSLKYLSLFILILSFSVNAQDLTAGQQQWQQYVPNWFPLFSIAALIGFGIVGISFMLARVFMLPQLESWARNELFEVVSSIFLVIISLIVLGIIDDLFIATTGSTPMSSSLDFTNQLSHKLIDIYKNSIYLGYAIGLLSGPPLQYLQATSQSNTGSPSRPSSETLSANSGALLRFAVVGIESFHMNFYPYYGADVFNSHYGLVQSIALTSLTISLFSKVLLSFINAAAIPIILPLGLFLSMFSLTRKMGRTMIAFGIGLYLFVPMSIMIAQIMYNSAYKQNTSVPEIREPTSAIDFSKAIGRITLVEIITGIALNLLAVAGFLSFPIPCALGALEAAAMFCPGPAMAVCATAFGTICATVTHPIFTLPTGLDQTANLNLFTTAIKTVLVAGALNVDVWRYIPTLTLPAISSLIGLATVFPWIASFVGVLASNPTLIATGVVASTLSISSEMSLFMANVILNKALAVKMTAITMEYTPYVMQYAVPAMLIPFIIIFITITGIRSLSPAIGGEVQILGVSELI